MKSQLTPPRFVTLFALCMPFVVASPTFPETSAMATLVVDLKKTLRRVPAWRGVHMAPIKGGYEEKDVVRLKEMGATCVRFGFNGMLLEEEKKPGEYNEAGFQYLDKFVGWCEKHGLGAILDMHNVVGRRKGEDTRIWIQYHGWPDPKIFQDRFVNLWREIARRFAHRNGVVAYELLNEPNPPYDDFGVWNELAKRATAAIREVDRIHPVIVDSIGYASPKKFRGLRPTGDRNTIYSFHNYQPSAYHEQKRPWDFGVDGGTYYYPGWIKGKYWNRSQLRAVIDPAVEFGEKQAVQLFCGEFGCVSDCPPMTDMIYLMDQITLFHELGVGWTMFNYMRRESKPYWKSHFDCNLFIYFIPEGRLYRFERKINFLRFFLEKEGEVLLLEQPEDEDVTFYGIKEPGGEVSLLIANKDGRWDRKARLEIIGLDSEVRGLVSVMERGTDDFERRGELRLEKNHAELTLPQLSITKVSLIPKRGGLRVRGKDAMQSKGVSTLSGSEK